MDGLEAFFKGRIWLKDFTPFPEEQIERSIAIGDLLVTKGITADGQCARCLEKSPHKILSYNCAKCGNICYYCRHCIQMGRISSCTELISWASSSPQLHLNHSFNWSGTLTAAQKIASTEVADSLARKENHLVYAVCGAGKTELLFQPIFDALQKGLRICIAAPRTDVVLELSPRIRAVFPLTTVHTLYGGAPVEEGFANIVISTTHQLYRFENAFDVMIVDEADAFPYSYDEALERAVLKAAKPDSPIVFVSATPSDKLLKATANRSEIFRRFHGHDLPVPVFKPLWGYKKKLERNTIPQKLVVWIEERIAKKQPFLLFLPTIELIEHSIPLFKKLDGRIEAVHSKDLQRKEKVMALRNGNVPGLLTSTILERGITIPNVQVAVVGADDALFNASALIQIAGRVGRSISYPAGDISFFHDGISREMDKAKSMITFYNRRGMR